MANVCVAVVKPFRLVRFAANETAGVIKRITDAEKRTAASFFIRSLIVRNKLVTSWQYMPDTTSA